MTKVSILSIDIHIYSEVAAEIICRSFATVAETLGLTPENCPSFTGFITTAANLVEKMEQPGYYCFGLFEDDHLIGFAALCPFNEGYELTRLAVLPEKRHFGYGRSLVNAVLSKARDLGLPGVGLGMIDENTVLKNWYQAQGFIITDIVKFDDLPFTVCAMYYKF